MKSESDDSESGERGDMEVFEPSAMRLTTFPIPEDLIMSVEGDFCCSRRRMSI